MNNTKKKNIVIGVMLTLIIIMGIAYAAFAANLNISGRANATITWDIRFTDIEEKSKTPGVIENNPPTANGTTVTFDVNLDVPGANIVYEITLENQGTIDAIVESIEASETSTGAIKYTIIGIKKGDTVNKQTTKKVTVKIELEDSVTHPGEIQNELMVSINFVQNVGQTIEGEDITIEGPNILKTTNTLIRENETVEYYDGTLLKGNITNNYVWYSGFLWRIMGSDKSGNIKLIMEENVTTIPWGASGTGLDNYNNNYILDWLNNYFYQRLKNTNIIVNGTWCSDVTTSSSSARITCTNSGTSKVILPTIDEYNLVGGTNSYLKNNQFFWTSTPYSSDNAWSLNPTGNASNYSVIIAGGARPAIKVSSNVAITSGNGTIGNAYILGETKLTNMTGQISTVATSGEYVSLADKIYRVVDKEADGVKLILDGYYTTTTSFGSTNVFEVTTDIYGIGYKLNNEVLTWLGISDNPNVMTTTWNQGVAVEIGNKATDYLASSGNIVTAKVGLIKLGEMLSGQSQSIISKQNYWTLTPYSSSAVCYVDSEGIALCDGVTDEYGARPVIKVSSSTTITGGNGTLSNPYQI